MAYLAGLSLLLFIYSLYSLGALSRSQGDFYSRPASNAHTVWTAIGVSSLFLTLFCFLAAIF